MAGLVAGLISIFDNPERRLTLTTAMAARALGVVIINFHQRGLLPTIPRFVTLILTLSQSVITMAMVRYPNYLPSAYYRALLKWSQYYTHDILEVGPSINWMSQIKSDIFLCRHISGVLSPVQPLALCCTEAAVILQPTGTFCVAFGSSSRSTSLCILFLSWRSADKSCSNNLSSLYLVYCEIPSAQPCSLQWRAR